MIAAWFKSIRPIYRLVDYATQAYLLLVGLLILGFYSADPTYRLLIPVIHIIAMLGLHWMILQHGRRPDKRALAGLRSFYPILLFTFFYMQSEFLNLTFVTQYLDGFFIRLEENLFGLQPSIHFMEALPYPAVSEFFYMSYFSYYLMVIGVGITLYLRSEEQFVHYISVISIMFYICYLLYIFLPVVGPPVFYSNIPGYHGQENLPYYPLEYPPQVTGGIFFNIMKILYRWFEGFGAAFPSSHVAVAIGTLYFSWRYLPGIRYPHLGAVVCLSLSTVYCRYHYVVDVIAGVLLAALLLPLGEYLHRRTGQS
jgi:membrane-associated phospholipid phosphatase